MSPKWRGKEFVLYLEFMCLSLKAGKRQLGANPACLMESGVTMLQ